MHGGHDRTSVLGLWHPVATLAAGLKESRIATCLGLWGASSSGSLGTTGTREPRLYRLFGRIIGKLLPIHAIFFSQIDIWQSDVSKLFVARRRDVNLMSCSRLIS